MDGGLRSVILCSTTESPARRRLESAGVRESACATLAAGVGCSGVHRTSLLLRQAWTAVVARVEPVACRKKTCSSERLLVRSNQAVDLRLIVFRFNL